MLNAYPINNRVPCLLVAILLSFSFSPVFSQLNFDFTAGKFMIKGQVTDIETKKPIPMANVIIVNTGKGLTCDNEGRFTLYVSPKDTLKFSSTGYLGKVVHIHDVDSTRYYTMAIELIHDFIKLKEVTIYPFKNIEEFKKAFVDEKAKRFVGIAPPKYSNKTVAPNFSNPISLLYDHVKRRSSADPNFKP